LSPPLRGGGTKKRKSQSQEKKEKEKPNVGRTAVE